MRFCLHNVVLKAKEEEARKKKKVEEVKTGRKAFEKSSKQRRTLSLPQEGKSNPQKSKSRAKTELNMKLLPYLKENQDPNSPRVKEKDTKILKKLKTKQKEPSTMATSNPISLRESIDLL